MKTNKTIAYGLFAVILARHGWRCLSALAGVFSKKKLLCLLTAWMLLVSTGCPEPTPTHTHDYGTEWSSNATQHWHECSCGEKADAADHTAGDWIVDHAATATIDGSKHKECTVCGYETETETIPATNATHTHIWGAWTQTIPPTCTEAGVKTRSCTIDPTHIDTETQVGDPALGHDWDWIETTNHTETTDGIETKTCSRCGETDGTRSVLASFTGIWIAEDNSERIIFNGSNYTWQDNSSDWINFDKGTFSLNENKTKVTFYRTHRWKNGTWETESETSELSIEISDNSITISNNSGWSLTYQKEATPVSAHAQAAPTHTLANNLTITLNGTGSTGNISAYAWECASYTANQGAVSAAYTKAQVDALIANAGTATATVEPRKAGTYVFRLTVTGDEGESDTDTVAVVVEVAEVTINLAEFDLPFNIETGDNFIVTSIDLTPSKGDGWEGFDYAKVSFTLNETDANGNTTTNYNYNNGVVSIPNGFTGHSWPPAPYITQTFYYNDKEVGSFYFNLRAVLPDTTYTFYRIYKWNAALTNQENNATATSNLNAFSPLALTICEVE